MKKEMFKVWDVETKSWLKDFTVDSYGKVLVLDEDENVMTNERDTRLVRVMDLKDKNGVTLKETDVIVDKGLTDNPDAEFVLVKDELGVIPKKLDKGKLAGAVIDSMMFVRHVKMGRVEKVGNVLEDYKDVESVLNG